MKVVDINLINPVNFTGGESYRFLLEKDGFGFAAMKTVIRKGGPYLWHYVNHKEVCFCVYGYGTVKNINTGEVHEIREGIAYTVPIDTPHEFTAHEETVLISMFNPPLSGNESHNKDGVYPASNYNKEKAKKIIKAVKQSNDVYTELESVINILTNE